MSSKRLVVCCDGTWNWRDQPAPTNVAKLHDAVAPSGPGGVPQVTWYEEGVGRRWGERLRGGAFGVGLSRNVRHCYRFLVDCYEPGDALFFFGFSRGAFTVRSLAGLVRNSGILRRRHLGRLDEAFALYRSDDDEDAPSGRAAVAFRTRYSHPEAEIAFIGVWDTVGALGIPIDGFRPPVLSRRWTFHDTTLSRTVRNAYHAVSIDDRRRPFTPTLWVHKTREDGSREEPPPQQTVRQVWFAGVHSDVGGGYPEPELAEIPLLWMADRARHCGLALRPGHLVVSPDLPPPEDRRRGLAVRPDPRGRQHDSMNAFYRLLRPLDRGLRGRRGEAVNASVASSVVARHEPGGGYDPPGLARWLQDGGAVTDVEPMTAPARPGRRFARDAAGAEQRR